MRLRFRFLPKQYLHSDSLLVSLLSRRRYQYRQSSRYSPRDSSPNPTFETGNRFSSSDSAHKIPSLKYGIVTIDSAEFESLMEGQSKKKEQEGIKVNQSDVATILYSSGTTGPVKGVALTHRNLSATIAGGKHQVRKFPMVAFRTVPLFHAYGLAISLRAVASGDCMVIIGGGRTFDLRKMYRVVESISRIEGTTGKLMANCEAKIVDPETGAALPPSKPGELWVRGALIMKGYVDNEEATAAILDSEGWLRTGDLCYINNGGFLFFVDRIKELIKYKGYQVAPAELEHLLNSHADVVEAAVVPFPDEEAGQVPVAFVIRQ
ncbi:hypothetical protein CRYUN_Cryun06bG0135300 [Craigia yunnanensis]